MNLAILHYHLNPGGVTRVIANHLLALDATAVEGKRLQVAIVCDGQRDGWPGDLKAGLKSIDLSFHEVPAIGYQTEPSADPAPVLEPIREVLADRRFDAGQTLLHAHNHSVGKNAAYPAALRELAREGYGVLLQPHDFAEDFRPANYQLLREAFGEEEFAETLYFRRDRTHYATLSRRDHDALNQAGVAQEQLHFLPNPVPDLKSLPEPGQARARLQQQFGVDSRTEYVLYPVRGIRRKNLGEFVLLSVLRNRLLNSQDTDRRSVFALTLAPLNPVARPYYDRWTGLAAELDLPCRFDVGGSGGLRFEENLVAADLIVTTSVAEGFGMVFLESWLAGRPLAGRNLPEITADFIDTGLQLDLLYDRLMVPVDWLSRAAITDALHRACRPVYAAYRLDPPRREAIEQALDRMIIDDRIDFGVLDERLQEVVIRRVAADEACCREVLDANPVLAKWSGDHRSLVESNQNVIRREYSLSASGRRLRWIYRQILEDNGRDQPAASADSVLRAFLELDRFRLIRT